MKAREEMESVVHVPTGGAKLEASLALAPGARGIVAFAHGSGSSRHSRRNREVAAVLHARGLGTLLLDLLTIGEEAVDVHTGRMRFDIELLGDRLIDVTRWLETNPATRGRAIGYFGASTGAAAALVAAAKLGAHVRAVVSRGGRPDLAGEALVSVRAPTLLIVGGADSLVLRLNQTALVELTCEKELVVVPHATHLFEEPGALEQVADLAARWFLRHLGAAAHRGDALPPPPA